MLCGPNNEPPNDFERHHLHPEYIFLDYAAECWPLQFRPASSEDQESFAQPALAICDSRTMRCRTWYSLYRRIERSKVPRFTNLSIASYSGLRVVVQLLLKQRKVQLDLQDPYGATFFEGMQKKKKQMFPAALGLLG